MADEEHVKEWIRGKLDRDIDPDRIKKTLEKTDRDPSLVDEVLDSNSGSSNTTEETAEPETDQSNDSPGDESAEEKEKTSTPEMEEPEDFGFDESENSGNSEEQDPFDSLKYAEEAEEEEEEGSDGFSMPDIDIDRHKVLPVLLLVLVAGVSFAGYQFFGDSISGAGSQVSGVLGPSCDGDIGTGVKIFAVNKLDDEGLTSAQVATAERADVKLEVLENGEVIGETVQNVYKRDMIRVEAIGDSVRIHEVGCSEPVATRNY